jgi:hypothetical protein
MIDAVRKLTSLPLDVHMMVEEPEKYFESFAGAGANGMTIHVEAAPHLQRQLARIRELGCTAGAALNPGTPLSAVREVIVDLDLLLVMTVNPGFGGQEFIAASPEKVARAREMLSEGRSPRRPRGRRRDRARHDCVCLESRSRHLSSPDMQFFRRMIRKVRLQRCAPLHGDCVTGRRQLAVVIGIIGLVVAVMMGVKLILGDELSPLGVGSEAPNFTALTLDSVPTPKSLDEYKAR